MDFKENVGIKLGLVLKFWKNIEDSYWIERKFEETENVLVTLSDKQKTTRFTYIKSKSGVSVRFLNEDNSYYATLWHKKRGTGGIANGERALREFKQCLKMFDIALATGEAELEVRESPFAPSQFVPLTDVEEMFLSLFKEGKTRLEISEELNLSSNKLKRIITSLKQKGYDEVGKNAEEITEIAV